MRCFKNSLFWARLKTNVKCLPWMMFLAIEMWYSCCNFYCSWYCLHLWLQKDLKIIPKSIQYQITKLRVKLVIKFVIYLIWIWTYWSPRFGIHQGSVLSPKSKYVKISFPTKITIISGSWIVFNSKMCRFSSVLNSNKIQLTWTYFLTHPTHTKHN